MRLAHIHNMFAEIDRAWIKDYQSDAPAIPSRWWSVASAESYQTMKAPFGGLYVTTRAQISPEDLGTNYALRDAHNVAGLVAKAVVAAAPGRRGPRRDGGAMSPVQRLETLSRPCRTKRLGGSSVTGPARGYTNSPSTRFIYSCSTPCGCRLSMWFWGLILKYAYRIQLISLLTRYIFQTIIFFEEGLSYWSPYTAAGVDRLAQIRCRLHKEIPAALAMARKFQWVASGAVSFSVILITRLIVSNSRGDLPGGRVLSRTTPSTPSSMQRCCQRRTVGFDFPVRRMISIVPNPPADNSTILARHTSCCGVVRPTTKASNRPRSPGRSWRIIPFLMPTDWQGNRKKSVLC